MGLILCENRTVEHPLYIPDMGLRVYSLEELCYVIYNYPLIAMDGLVNDRLMRFLRDDLQIGMQVITLEKSLTEWANYDDVLLAILNFSDYYTNSETEEYRTRINEIRKLPRYEFYLRKGDLLFELRQYGKAITYYERSLFDSKDQKADDNYFYRVYRGMGATYANLYQLDEAFNAFLKVKEFRYDEDILRQIYFLARLQDNIEKKQMYLEAVKEMTDTTWDKDFEEVMLASTEDKSVTEIDDLINLDAVKKHRSIENILNRWKRKYRNML